MARQLLIAAGVGAVVSTFFYCCMALGLRIGFAAADYRARSREAHERTETP